MTRKGLVIIVLAIFLQGCDSDFRQGSCDEGFFEQIDGNGGSFCVPITEVDAIQKTEIDNDVIEKKD